jgi:catechol 2,3-dioxygenase-like lactoylglutathione lyase family enzyme
MSLIGPIKRVTLWVRDVEASLSLYRDVLGLEVIEDKVLEGPPVRALLGLESGRLRIVHLSADGRPHGWVGLYALTEASPAPPSLAHPHPDRFSYGQAVVVFDTQHLDVLLPRLEQGGYRLLGTPIDYVKPSVSGPTPAGRYREVIFFDPDGIPVSLIQSGPA